LRSRRICWPTHAARASGSFGKAHSPQAQSFSGDGAPIDAAFGGGEELLLELPQDVDTVGEKLGPLHAVAPLVGLTAQQLEERAVTAHRGDDTLVARALARPIGHAPQGVDDADHDHFRVLALVPGSAATPRHLAPSAAPRVPLRRVARRTSRLAASRMLRGADQGDAFGVRLDDDNLAVALGCLGQLQELLRVLAGAVDHAQHRSRARSPLEDALERGPRRAEGHLGAQPHEGQRRRQTEARAHLELAIHPQIASPTRLPYRAAHRTWEGDLAEARADLRGARAAQLQCAARVLVHDRSRARRLPHEVERD
jgi:hypothetical protein